MNIHEYQAKQLFEKFHIATPKGAPASTAEEAQSVASRLGIDHLVVKAQIHAGGRGKGTFADGFQGGVHLCDSPEKAANLAGKMLGNTLRTHQTGTVGRVVRKVLIAESVEIAKEYYFAIVLDRAIGAPMIIASTEGGVEIEDVAEKTPEKIIKEPVHPLLGLQAYQARNLAHRLGFESSKIAEAATLFLNIFKLFLELDCSLVEVNPLVLTCDGKVFALDAKF
ncbi:MAG: succinate--CoA ligase subunit beta, partial [Verrucomicrobia bacterium]